MNKKIVAFLIVWGILFAAGWLWIRHQIPSGDEPHYLIIAQSLISDHDLDLKNNYAQKDYQIWGYQILDAHISLNSVPPHGYSVHNIGWPLVFTPFFALAGRAGIAFLTSLLGALLFINIFLILKKVVKNQTVRIIISSIIIFSIPIFIYSNQVFNEIFAAFLVLYAFRKIIEEDDNLYGQILTLLAISYLPWIHIKYLLISLVLLSWWIYKFWRKKTLILGIIYIASLFVLGYLFKHWYGSFSPNAQYPANLAYDFKKIGQGIVALLFDRTFGIFVYSPIYFLSLAGFYFLYKDNKLLFIKLLTVFLALFLVQALNATMIGWAPIGRFLVVVLPLLSIPLTFTYIHLKKWSKILFWLLSGWGLLVSLILFRYPRLDYNISEPQFLKFISPHSFSIWKIFPNFLSDGKYTILDHSTILCLSCWIIIILAVNLIIIFNSRKS